jgi:hypothetical protein
MGISGQPLSIFSIVNALYYFTVFGLDFDVQSGMHTPLGGKVSGILQIVFGFD